MVSLQLRKRPNGYSRRGYNQHCLSAAIEPDRLRVVLVASRNPLNIGAAARAMSNFGFRHLRVVNPYEIAFREASSAVGASSLLANAEEYDDVASAVADCALVVGTTALRHRELQHTMRLLPDAATLIRTQLTSRRVALLFGSEKVGLSNRDLSHCHWLLHIPVRAENISMNLGQAVAVCLYELRRQAGASVRGQKSSAKPTLAGETELLTAMLLDALNTSGYLNPATKVRAEERVRRLVRRLNLSGEDARIWLGMMRQILWKLRGDEPSVPVSRS